MTLHGFAMGLYLFGSALLALFGLRYLLSRRAMPYHLIAMGKRWDEVEGGTGAILLALMRCAGAGYLAIVVGSVFLVIGGLGQHLAWANVALLFVYVVLLVPLTWVMLGVRRRTSAHPPLGASVIGLLLVAIAFTCEWIASARVP